MQVISRIQFPQTVETSDLYFNLDKNTSLNSLPEDRKNTLCKGCTLSFNTYFNSIYEKFYTKYTILNSLYYFLKLEGDFLVTVYKQLVTGKIQKNSVQTVLCLGLIGRGMHLFHLAPVSSEWS